MSSGGPAGEDAAHAAVLPAAAPRTVPPTPAQSAPVSIPRRDNPGRAARMVSPDSSALVA